MTEKENELFQLLKSITRDKWFIIAIMSIATECDCIQPFIDAITKYGLNTKEKLGLLLESFIEDSE